MNLIILKHLYANVLNTDIYITCGSATTRLVALSTTNNLIKSQV